VYSFGRAALLLLVEE